MIQKKIITLAGLMFLPLLGMDEQIESLKKTIEKNRHNIFASSSVFSLETQHHTHQVQEKLKKIMKPSKRQIVTDADTRDISLPVLPTTNSQQDVASGLLGLAQNVEEDLATNPSSTAKVLRILFGAGIAVFGGADLVLNYVYAAQDLKPGQKAVNSTFSIPTDLGIIGTGVYQVVLGIANYDTKTKAADASVATALVRGHIAQQTVAGDENV